MMAGQTYEFLHRNDGISGVLDFGGSVESLEAVSE